jgi:hypothetical protein
VLESLFGAYRGSSSYLDLIWKMAAVGTEGEGKGAARGGASHTAPNPAMPGASNRVAPEDGVGTEGGPGAKEHNVLPMKALFERTVSLLKRREFQSADPRSFKGLKKRLEMMHEAGLPRMRLLPGGVLEELGRIPRSTDKREDGEPYTVDALEMIEREGSADDSEMPSSIIAFFSHRWLPANFSTLHQKDVEWGSAEWLEAAVAEKHYVGMPDSEGNDKARDLIEWMRWLKWRTSRETKFMENYLPRKCRDVYFFIDWPCVDQTDPVAEICALPAFVSSCSLIASYFTEEYKGRAWCQAELLVARAFCALPVVMRVPLGFKHEEQLFLTAGQLTLPDPSNEETAMITNQEDRPTILELTTCARESRAFTYAQCTRNITSDAGLGGGAVGGLTMLVISFGLIPLLLCRKIVPGKSGIQLVEPRGARVPHSWSQVKLWFHLSPDWAVASVLLLFVSFEYLGVSMLFFVKFYDPTVWNSHLVGSFSVLVSLSGISASVLLYPSIQQATAPHVHKRLKIGIIVWYVLAFIGFLASFVESYLRT